MKHYTFLVFILILSCSDDQPIQEPVQVEEPTSFSTKSPKWSDTVKTVKPSPESPWYESVSQLMALNKHEKALTIVEKLLLKDIKNYKHRLVAANLYIELKKYKLANQILNDHEDKNSANYMNLMGKLAYGKEEFQNAEKWFLQAIQADKHQSFEYSLNLANLYMKFELTSKAQEVATKAFELNPSNPDVQFSYATIHLKESKPQKYIKILETLHRDYPQNSEVAVNLALGYFYNKQYSLASEHFSKVIENHAKEVAILTKDAKSFSRHLQELAEKQDD